jgi:hypothetical protein
MVGRDHGNNTDNEDRQQDDEKGDGHAPEAEAISTVSASLATNSGIDQSLERTVLPPPA